MIGGSRILLVVVLAASTLAACVRLQVELAPQPLPAAEDGLLPLAVGIYYPPRLQEYVYEGRPSSVTGSIYVIAFPLGRAVTALVPASLAQVFSRVEVIPDRTRAQLARKGLDGYVEIDLNSFDYRFESDVLLAAEISLQCRFVDMHYRPLYSGFIGGSAVAGVGTATLSPKDVQVAARNLAERALRLAAANLAAALRQDRQIALYVRQLAARGDRERF